jgi:trk system potassium uptake protein TrkH
MLVTAGGFDLSSGLLRTLEVLNFLFAAVFVGEFLLAARAAPNRKTFLSDARAEAVLAVLLLLGILAAAFGPRTTGIDILVVPAKVYLVLNLLLEFLTLFRVTSRSPISYARSFVLSFIGIILIGSLLLYLLPGAKAPGARLPLVDAVFTATSATCVTGLITVDTGSHFSRFGQTIIMILFQLGGLGLMTFAAFFAIALGRGMGLREREVMRGVLNLRVGGSIVRVVIGILLFTLLVEAISALCLYGRWSGTPGAGFSAVFHAISAFCNAGFSLHADSLEGFVTDPVVNWIVMAEIVIGGLGFGVLLDLMSRRLFGVRLFGWLRPVDQAGRRRFSVQTRIVLWSTAVLIVLGAVLVFVFEASNPATIGDLSFFEKVQASVFQSVTARTAGFNTIPIGEMHESTQFLTMLLMLIGASPGSTGGGVKTVTTVVLILAIFALARNRRRVEVFQRTLPGDTVSQAVVIVSCAIMAVTFTTLLLTAVEGGRHPFLSLFFEVASAFGTVGLSTGITAELSVVSKLAICVTMFVGRVGPLFLVFALAQRTASRPYEYPEEHVMIG